MTPVTKPTENPLFVVCGDSYCGWSQMAGSSSDADWLQAMHAEDKHEGSSVFAVPSSLQWVPPVYFPDAHDYREHMERAQT